MLLGMLWLLLCGSIRTDAQHSDATPELPRLIGAQITVIAQGAPPFHSPYAGPNSLDASGDAAVSHTYGVYFGDWLTRRLQAYLDIEMARGAGISHAAGLAGYTNGDVIRQGTVDLGQGPYVARGFLRYTIPLGGAQLDTLIRGMDQLSGMAPASRIELAVGKVASPDFFDLNRYANSTRSQFMNWALFNNTAWDYAADTRGYTNGIAIAWITPRWALRYGSFQMPIRANGNDFDSDVSHARGDNLEVTWSPSGEHAPVLRLLGYMNHARMGRYAEALAIAERTHQKPNIAADDRPGRVKFGVGLNTEVPVADSGTTGAFLRLGWNDDRTESFAFTEVKTLLSGGLQVSGARWRRTSDRLGLAVVSHGLGPLHRRYLEEGGDGFMLGDGSLAYGRETIVEGYYLVQLGPYVEITPDVQHVNNPGYNRARGPALVFAVRGNLRW
jgi:hypothetical protein